MSEVENHDMNTVILKDGTEEAEVLVNVVMCALENMIATDAVLFYELVMKCRHGDNHEFFSPAIERKLSGLGMYPIHDSLRNIVNNAVVGDGLNMRLVSPVGR